MPFLSRLTTLACQVVGPYLKVAPVQRSRSMHQIEVNLPHAQQQALRYQKKADVFAEKKLSEIRKAHRYLRHGNLSAADYFRQIAREHGMHEKSLREQASDVIITANKNSAVLDLHLLSQKEAILVLKNRLFVLDRPQPLRNGRSSRRLRVITGYGKGNGGRSVIKPAVECYLKKNGYFYSFANMGEIVIQCK
ncbi:Smr domain protein [Dictyocaulus viviparus]|uniref:Smr domain protein n=1 Tax=Dictyocaulus viviparus TaxID=29172 RepID=A0A0D8Y6G5_DICVI|nr:Smr domain protein [Dictyocaulus viviparus]